jgi:hypothetical protein
MAHAWASRSAVAGALRRLEPAAFGAFRAADAGFLFETIIFACCVMLPTMALPPSPTDTFYRVMAGSPWLRWRLSASIWAGNVRASLPNARAALSCWMIYEGPSTSDDENEAIRGFEIIRARRADFLKADGTLDTALWYPSAEWISRLVSPRCP